MSPAASLRTPAAALALLLPLNVAAAELGLRWASPVLGLDHGAAAGTALLSLLALLLGSALVGCFTNDRRCALWSATLVLAVFPALCAVSIFATSGLAREALEPGSRFASHVAIGSALGTGGVLACGLRGLCRIPWSQAASGSGLVLSLALLPSALDLRDLALGLAGTAQRDIAAWREPMDVEALYYAQPQRLSQQHAALLPGRPGVADLYFVGFAAWGPQDVFRNEILFARDQFVERLGAAGRSAVLVNSARTQAELPIASVSNLERTLAEVGARMDSEEDVLFLLLTSHGSRSDLSVRFGDMQLNDLNPERLDAMIRDAGVRWRVVVVSACYSGIFVEPLRDPYTLVMTAAAEDRQSFGCSNTARFTYFGEALLSDQLPRAQSFKAAFEGAREAVAARELDEDRTPSQPQLWYGEQILAKLRDVEASFEPPRAQRDPG